MTVTLTESAERYLFNFLSSIPEGDGDRGIRFIAKAGGCNGYEYDIKIATHPKPDDEVNQSGRLKIFVDPQSAPILNGMTVNYIDGLLDSGFKFENPNATQTCGCGKSFDAGACTPTAVPCS
ncbi:HesB/IscA family protein [Vacuolonema iberomarrocanum]|uniref:HesB/IscA family protein n=1 Tax=Vacuolonema iberomarrocanum TaxID=3454632 RepID=UPI001A038CA8|nr:iron-sulfur cluster assembly accessory protein [filamentous cyanobacterium LEGE 07170]